MDTRLCVLIVGLHIDTLLLERLCGAKIRLLPRPRVEIALQSGDALRLAALPRCGDVGIKSRHGIRRQCAVTGKAHMSSMAMLANPPEERRCVFKKSQRLAQHLRLLVGGAQSFVTASKLAQ